MLEFQHPASSIQKFLTFAPIRNSPACPQAGNF